MQYSRIIHLNNLTFLSLIWENTQYLDKKIEGLAYIVIFVWRH